MEKIRFQYTLLPQDYANSISIFLINRRRRNAVATGFILLMIFFFVVNIILNLKDRVVIYSLPILFILILIPFAPYLSGWLTKRKASKQPILMQPIACEMDNDRIFTVNQVAENKMDWSVFNKVVETKEYYFLIYSVNKNAFQIIPKRAFESIQQEQEARILFEQKLGKIENIQIGLRGWKLSFLTFVVLALFSGGCLVLALLLEYISNY